MRTPVSLTALVLLAAACGVEPDGAPAPVDDLQQRLVAEPGGFEVCEPDVWYECLAVHSCTWTGAELECTCDIERNELHYQRVWVAGELGPELLCDPEPAPEVSVFSVTSATCAVDYDC